MDFSDGMDELRGITAVDREGRPEREPRSTKAVEHPEWFTRQFERELGRFSAELGDAERVAQARRLGSNQFDRGRSYDPIGQLWGNRQRCRRVLVRAVRISGQLNDRCPAAIDAGRVETSATQLTRFGGDARSTTTILFMRELDTTELR